MPRLINVVPNEQWQLVLEFAGEEHRLFDGEIARVAKGWSEFAYPNKLKNLTFTEEQVTWPGGRTLAASYLYAKSKRIEGDVLRNQSLRLGYKNQAPTPVHPLHHVYGVYLFPFSDQPFAVGESIGGGHGEMGGSASYSLAELTAWQEWRDHFELSGCGWAVPIVESASGEGELLHRLVREVCFREGTVGA